MADGEVDRSDDVIAPLTVGELDQELVGDRVANVTTKQVSCRCPLGVMWTQYSSYAQSASYY
jgi:hypothetical protein